MGPEEITELEDRIAKRVYREVSSALYQSLMVVFAVFATLTALFFFYLNILGGGIVVLLAALFFLYARRKAPYLGKDSSWNVD